MPTVDFGFVMIALKVVKNQMKLTKIDNFKIKRSDFNDNKNVLNVKMTYVQVILLIMKEERGYNLQHYEKCGYCPATIRNWTKNRSSPSVSMFAKFIEDMNYDPVKILIKVARYENRRCTKSA